MRNGHLTTEDVRKLLKKHRGWSAFSPETSRRIAHSASNWLLDEPRFTEASSGEEQTPGDLDAVNNWYVWDEYGAPVRFSKRKPKSKMKRSFANVPERILAGHRLLWLDAEYRHILKEPKEGFVVLQYNELNSCWTSVGCAPAQYLVAAVEVSKHVDKWIAGEID